MDDLPCIIGAEHDDAMQRLFIRTSQVEAIQALVADAAQIDDGRLSVPWTQEVCETLGRLRAPLIPAMARDYDWPGKYSPFPHQYRIAGFLASHPRAFCLADLGCVDADTEYLSPTGWKRIADYSGGLVAQYHPDTGVAEFVQPTAYVDKPCEVMIHFTTERGVDQMLSPEHRVLWVNPDTEQVMVSSAAEVAIRHAESVRGFKGRFPACFDLHTESAGLALSTAEVRVQVAVMADGHFPSATGTRCVIRVTKERKKNRLRQLLADAGIEFTEHEQPSDPGYTRFTFYAPRREKEFGPEWWGCSDEQRRTITDEVFHWDGSFRRDKAPSFATRSMASAEFIQFAVVSSGRSASITSSARRRERDCGAVDYQVNVRTGRSPLSARTIGMSCTGNPEKKTQNVRIVEAPGGRKYCFMVPSTFLVLRRNGNVFCSGNTGKTLSTLWALDYLFRLGRIKKVLVLAPLSILRSAWLKEITESFPHMTATVVHHTDPTTRRRRALSEVQIHIANYSSVEICYDQLMANNYDVVVIDECFVAGTPVSTPSGSTPIERLRTGDVVTTEFGPRPITRTGRRYTNETVTLELSDGRHIVTTPEHPIFTDVGWVPARDCEGRQVFGHRDMPEVLGTLRGQHDQPPTCDPCRDTALSVLREILRSELVAHAQPRSIEGNDHQADCGYTNDADGVCTDAGDPRQVEPGPSSHRASPAGTWRQRNYGTVRSFGGVCHAGVDTAVCGPIGETAARLSNALQAGLRSDRQDAGHRAGRPLACGCEPAGSGQAEGQPAHGTRVARVTHQEHRDPVEVFNLTVEGVPHFFAADVLTHNCTAYKKYGTRRWKFIRPLAEKVPFLWMLTGTPAVQYPLDAFGQVKLMYQHWDMSETRFKMATMVQHSKYRWVPLDDSQDTIYAVMQPAIKVAKRDVLKDLPPVMHSTRDVEMTAEQKAAMKELRKQAMAEIGHATISAVHAAAMRIKLVQIASGVVYDDDRNEVQVDYKDRFEELCNIVTQARDEAPKTGPIGGKFIVLAAFTHTVERLAKDLADAGLRVAVLHGGVSLSRRTEIVRQFQETRDLDGVVAIPDVMSHGLTLTAANTTVWFTPIDKAEVALQANNRMDRPGQIQHMHIYRLCGCEAERIMYDAMDRRFDYHTDLVGRYKDFVDAL